MSLTFPPLETWNAPSLNATANPGKNTGCTVAHPHPSPSEIQRMNLDECYSAFDQILNCLNIINGGTANDSQIYNGNDAGTELVGASKYNQYVSSAYVQALELAAKSDARSLKMLSRRIIDLQLFEKTPSASVMTKHVFTESPKKGHAFFGCCPFFM